MKIVRVFIILKTMVREIKVFMRPSSVVIAKLGGKPIEPVIIAHICAFFAILSSSLRWALS